ncbi:MAG: MMPL family transporter, partial [Planctomycetes bacterium]|nr:MMPL family transporter [Planctomycetota bacterium]
MSNRIAEWLIRWRFVLLLVGIGMSVVAYFPSSNLDFDRSIENMFPEKEEDEEEGLLPPYRRLAETFGGNEIVMLAYRDDNFIRFDENGNALPDETGIQRVKEISERARKVPGVRGTLSLAELSEALDFVSRKDPPTVVVNSGSRMGTNFRKLFEGFTHSDDYTIVAVVCMLHPERPGGTPRQTTIDGLRRIAYELPEGRIAGEPVMVVDGFRFVEEDGRRLGRTTTILLAMTIVLCFRSLRWVIIPLAVVQFAIFVTQAVLVVSGMELSMVSSMLTAIVTVVGIATVVHFIVRFREARSHGHEPREALTRAVALLIVPVFWACTTDAVGFLSLLAAKVGPVKDFGVMMFVGSLIVLLSVALLLPGLVLLRRFGWLAWIAVTAACFPLLAVFGLMEQSDALQFELVLIPLLVATCNALVIRGSTVLGRSGWAVAVMLLAFWYPTMFFVDWMGWASFPLWLDAGNVLLEALAAIAASGMLLFILLGCADDKPHRAWGEKLLDARLGGMVNWIESSPWVVGALVVILVGATVVGVGFVEVETDFTKNFVDDADDPTDIVSTYEFVESKLGGAGVWD